MKNETKIEQDLIITKDDVPYRIIAIKNNKFEVVNIYTGEIKLLLTSDLETEYNRSKKAIEAAKRKFQQKNDFFEPTAHWVASFHKENEALSEISIQTAGAIMTLMLYLNIHGDGILMINGEPVTKQDIDDILGVDDKTSKSYLDEAIEYKILSWTRQKIEVPITFGKDKGKRKKISANVYTINPEYICMGTFPNTKTPFTRVFKTKAKKHIEFLSIEARGFLYKLLPKIHFQSHYITNNPNLDLRKDKNYTYFKNIEQKTLFANECLNIYDLTQIAGKSKAVVDRYYLEFEAARIMLKDGMGRKSKFFVNPGLLTRNNFNCEFAVSLEYIFDQTEPSYSEVRKQVVESKKKKSPIVKKKSSTKKKV
ncbi:hypothetical protein AB4Z45_27765 [Paenibacillus sp. MCAF9]|uniref:hypothetical protein n=1 Tax=Paenibacillus sp. MCAF9 TaxID=3233046 RepID=UPI003F9C1F20